MVLLTKGDWLWLEPEKSGEFAVAVGARVINADSNKLVLITDEKREVTVSSSSSSLRHMHVSSIEGVEDMIHLGDLHEAGILRNIILRYHKNLIYTYTGSILVAVNPYKILPIYTIDQINQYKDKKFGELPPHIFAVGDNAYHNMVRYCQNQCVIISGESGAGKTESTKLILQFLAVVSGRHSWVEQQILEANPLMEAFGNAKTTRNDNSSRFGKFVDIRFGEEGSIEGAVIEEYLLERSRIVHQNKGERNYHIFYCMLAGLTNEQKHHLHLTNARDFYYLIQGNEVQVDGRDDAVEFSGILSCMKVLNFSEEDTNNILLVLASLLHLGNVRHIETTVDNMDATQLSGVHHLNNACALLQLNSDKLSSALTTKSILTRGEVVVSNLHADHSTDVKDAFVKGIYGHLFVWIVEKINEAIFKPESSRPDSTRPASNQTSIGVLDIFGFENFDKNSFEQLCINYANENLQQFFVKHIFKLEQEEYNIEGINWTNIAFTDNQAVLDLLSIKPLNVFSLVDEESRFPKGSDMTLVGKLNQHHRGNKLYLKPKSELACSFALRHFAGVVFYDAQGFLEKNRDTFNLDLLQVIESSSFKFLSNLFSKDFSLGTETRKRSVTLASRFKKSLSQLMLTLETSQPFFIRCIKPNELKKPMTFDKDLCIRQLRYSGMMETIRIRKSGYPIRHAFKEFVERYRVLLSGDAATHRRTDMRELAGQICQVALRGQDFQVGRTKVFLKDAHDAYLEEAREKVLYWKICQIQRVIKTWRERRRFLRVHSACLVLQKNLRCLLAVAKFHKLRNGYLRLQAVYKSRGLACTFVAFRSRLLSIQRISRCYLERHKHSRILQHVVVLQAAVRRMAAREMYARMRKQYHLKLESLEQMQREEQMLLKSMPAKKAKAEAERLHRERMERLELAMEEEKGELEKRMVAKKSAISLAEKERREPVDHSRMVDEMFGFVERPDNDGEPPEGFKDLEDPRRRSTHHADVITMDDADEEEDNDDVSNYKFSKFTATYFGMDAPKSHTRSVIKNPLLTLQNEGDQLAALAVWITILRFMGDLPEPLSIYTNQEVKDTVPVMAKVYSSLGRKFNRKDVEEAQKMSAQLENEPLKENKSITRKIVSMTLKKKSKISQQVVNKLKDGDYGGGGGGGNALLEDKPSNPLQKLHFIIGHGILRPELRDEIYCQLCCQLTLNPSRKSFSRGWILLSLCLGCFPPSDRFVKYLRCFLKSGPPAYSPYCDKRLRRTFANGARNQPPSWLELQATKSKKSIVLPVAFMDGSTKSLLADSATTAHELCSQLASKINLVDTFGFSLFIALYDKFTSLGSGNDHIMDTISQCEQFAIERGADESTAPWRLYFRKEIFAPWHDPQCDPVSTNLIYQQIIRAIKLGEYRCDKNKDLSMISAQQYYVEFGREVVVERLSKLLPTYLPKPCLTSEKMKNQWIQSILESISSSYFDRNDLSPLKVKQDIVKYAKYKWPLLFSRFYEAHKFAGPSLPLNEVIVAVNWTGFYALDDSNNVILELTFPEITAVSSSRSGKQHGQSFTLLTIQGQEFTFTSPNSQDIRDLVVTFLEGLKSRSKFLIALQSYIPPSNRSDLLSFKSGDLIILTNENGQSMSDMSWCNGTCQRTNQNGEFPTDYVYILPTITRPSSEILRIFEKHPVDDTERFFLPSHSSPTSDLINNYYTLQKYANDHFREAVKKENVLWSYNKQPLTKPLLTKVAEKSDLVPLSLKTFTGILRYMGDQQGTLVKTGNQLTDIIFEPPIKYEILRDEVYCQLLKQLTGNPSRPSEGAGWELMWLATGCFPPSNILLEHTSLFFRSRSSNPFAVDCLSRLHKTLKNGTRKYPPHHVEVEAIQLKTTQIFHKVYFPDGTNEAFEVESSTRSKDFCREVSNRLQLINHQGFSLFVKIAGKVISVPEGDFFFDFVRHLTDWLRKARLIATETSANSAHQLETTYQVFFMKKLWLNTLPGADLNADLKFHYPQELPKYLRGYHKCSPNEAAKLAAFIVAASNSVDFQLMQSNLQDFVPADLLQLYPPSEWALMIRNRYNSENIRSASDAKVQFLSILHQWPTFGSSFFEVEQRGQTNFPQLLLVAINKNGVTLIDPKSKNILSTFPFTRISNWSSGNNHFHMTIGNLVHGHKLLFETKLGYKMDDLLTSYISLMMTLREQNRTLRS